MDKRLDGLLFQAQNTIGRIYSTANPNFATWVAMATKFMVLKLPLCEAVVSELVVIESAKASKSDPALASVRLTRVMIESVVQARSVGLNDFAMLTYKMTLIEVEIGKLLRMSGVQPWGESRLLEAPPSVDAIKCASDLLQELRQVQTKSVVALLSIAKALRIVDDNWNVFDSIQGAYLVSAELCRRAEVSFKSDVTPLAQQDVLSNLVLCIIISHSVCQLSAFDEVEVVAVATYSNIRSASPIEIANPALWGTTVADEVLQAGTIYEALLSDPSARSRVHAMQEHIFAYVDDPERGSLALLVNEKKWILQQIIKNG